MFHRYAATHLPLPHPLREAVSANHVALSYAADGTVAYVIGPACPNRPAALAAIATRKQWELWVAGIEGAVVKIATLLGLAALFYK